MICVIIETENPEETFALGQKIGRAATPGQVYTLTGDLGVGKTVFTQGVAAGLGITEPVSSPTFTIVQVYEEGRLPFYHFDVYRIGDIEEMEEIGYDDYFFGEGICLIEWAELIERDPSGKQDFHNHRERSDTEDLITDVSRSRDWNYNRLRRKK